MTPERFKLVRELFLELLDLTPAERSARLDEACADDDELRAGVEKLLVGHERDSTPDVLGPATLTDCPPALAEEPDQKGVPAGTFPGYEITREIHRGGQGVDTNREAP